MTDESPSEEVVQVAAEVAEVLNNSDKYEALNGRAWSEENDIEEATFAEAFTLLTGATCGISPMYPFRNDDVVDVEYGVAEEFLEEEEEGNTSSEQDESSENSEESSTDSTEEDSDE